MSVSFRRGQFEPEGAARIVRLFDAHFAPHALRRPAHDGQAHPRPLLALVNAIEHAKNPVAFALGDSLPVIAETQSHSLTAGLRRNPNHRPTSLGRELD